MPSINKNNDDSNHRYTLTLALVLTTLHCTHIQIHRAMSVWLWSTKDDALLRVYSFAWTMKTPQNQSKNELVSRSACPRRHHIHHQFTWNWLLFNAECFFSRMKMESTLDERWINVWLCYGNIMTVLIEVIRSKWMHVHNVHISYHSFNASIVIGLLLLFFSLRITMSLRKW